jgi:streptogrisin C
LTRRRGTKPWAIAGFGAAGAAIVVTATVLMGSATSPVNGQGPGAGDTVVMSAVQRDLSLTADQTSARLKKQAWASGAERRLQKALGADFAGAWMTKNGQALMVGVTTDQAADVVRRAGATPKLVERSQAQLDAFQQSLNSTKVTGSAVTGWYVDPATNRLVVVTKAGDTEAAHQLAAAGGVPSNAVRVVTTEQAPRLLFDVRGADPFFIDNQFRCSVGFAVQGGFVSAGHCGQVGSTTTGFNQQAQGTFKASQFPGNGDFSFVEVNGDWTPQPVVATSTGLVPVAGAEEAPIGATVCRSGSTTGTHCGVIQAKNATVRYPEGTVTGLTQTDVCAEGGDSGGPWMSGDQGQGVTSGGSGDCTVGGTTFFQPLAEILAVDNLQLVTTADPAPPVTAPPASDPAVTSPPVTDPPAGSTGTP